jgi:hypothetical protein
MADGFVSITMVMARKPAGKKPVKKLTKGVRRRLHYSKNALNMHRRTCQYPGECTYGTEFGARSRDVNDAAVMRRHVEVCMAGPGPHDMRDCKCWQHLQEFHCQAAADAENGAAEIERHLAAIRKIKRLGKPLKGKESYRVYPE